MNEGSSDTNKKKRTFPVAVLVVLHFGEPTCAMVTCEHEALMWTGRALVPSVGAEVRPLCLPVSMPPASGLKA